MNKSIKYPCTTPLALLFPIQISSSSPTIDTFPPYPSDKNQDDSYSQTIATDFGEDEEDPGRRIRRSHIL
jgi:hypothetical protein